MHAQTASIADRKKNSTETAFMSHHKKTDDVHSIIISMLAKHPDGVVQIAPGIAKRILEETNFEGQRPLKLWRVDVHTQRLQDETWVPEFAVYFVDLGDGRFWLVDGQHRMAAIANQDAAVKVRISIIHVQDEEHARRVYASFDRVESVRTTAEILDSVQSPERNSLGKAQATKIFTAIGFLNNRLEPPRGVKNCSVDKRIDGIDEWSSEARQFFDDIKPAPEWIRRRLSTAGCLAVAMLTYRYQPAKAAEFWGGVANDDGLKKGDPRHTLLRDMQSRHLGAGSARQTVQAPSLAWNAFFEGRNLTIVKCINDSPIVVLGTPYKKGNR